MASNQLGKWQPVDQPSADNDHLRFLRREWELAQVKRNFRCALSGWCFVKFCFLSERDVYHPWTVSFYDDVLPADQEVV